MLPIGMAPRSLQKHAACSMPQLGPMNPGWPPRGHSGTCPYRPIKFLRSSVIVVLCCAHGYCVGDVRTARQMTWVTILWEGGMLGSSRAILLLQVADRL